MGKLKWNIESIREFFIANNRNIELLSTEYIKYEEKLRFNCLICGETWSAAWSSVKSGTGCPNCSNNKPLNGEDILKKLKPLEIKKGYSILNKSEIINTKSVFSCECNNGHKYSTSYQSLSIGSGCPFCNKERMRKQSKDKIIYAKDTKLAMKNINPNIEILNDDYSYSELDCRCKICGNEFKSRHNRLVIGKHGCGVCKKNQIKIGYNDIQTIRPDLVKYFKNKDDAKKSINSKETSVFKCVECGFEKEQKIGNAFATGKYCCSACSDGISIPNKMLSNILIQLGIQFEVEKTIKGSNYRYDAYFEINDERYVCEAHGRQHYDKGFNFKKDINEQIKKNDEDKKKFANSNGIKYLEIDCKFSDYEYLLKSFTDSLSEIFNLSNVDFKKVYSDSMSSKMIEVCNMYNSNPKLTPRKIAEITRLTDVTVRTYLKRGNKLNLCNYDPEKIKESEKLKVLKIDILTNEIIEEYESLNSASRNSGDSAGNISRIINGLQKTTKKHTWIRKSDYKNKE